MSEQPDNEATENVEIQPAPFKRPDRSAEKKRFEFRPVPVLTGLLFVILSLAALFMFTAKAVKFIVSPLPETLEITQGTFTYKLGDRFLMLPGDYVITARRKGYRDLDQPVTVGDAPDQDFRFTMQKLPGILEIRSIPEVNARIHIDQNYKGNTPATIEEIEPGLHDVTLSSERYLPWQSEIDIEGKRVRQLLEAELEPAWADITVTSMPSGAMITVDGEEAGHTPATIEVLEGNRQLTVKKPGYKAWQTDIQVLHGENQELPKISLIRSDGKISIASTPAGANVTINERYRGQTPVSLSLPPAESYQLLLSKAGYEPLRKQISIQPDEDLSMNFRLNPVMGTIRLQVQPPGGELFIDGKSMGEPSRQISLTASRHKLEIRHKDYADYTTIITPQPGLSQQLLITLQTREEARAAAIPQTITTSTDQTLKLILPGKLQMGAGRRERGRRSNEILKEVELTRAYYLGTHEVTNKQYGQFDPSHDSGVFGRALLNEEDRPVVNVPWSEAVRYCNWLSQRDGLPAAYEQVGDTWRLVTPFTRGYRLPTEAEWAWAARYASGRTPRRFPWGDTMPPTQGSGNYADESATGMVPYSIAGYNDGYRGPAPVGSYEPNEFGLYDLAGNVSEWIHDYYSVTLVRKPLTDPVGPEKGDYHVIRGSNYTSGRFSELRWTFRDYGSDGRRDTGFRIARWVE